MKIQALKEKWFFPVIGFLALIWFLIRVIPKPSRATYPCQRAAFPLATSFVIWLTGTFTSVFAIKKARSLFQNYNLFYASLYLFTGLMLASVFISGYNPELFAKDLTEAEHPSNMPIGQAKGIFPGRVIWAWNPDAVNENTPNTWKEEDNWWMNKNTSKSAVNNMVRASVLKLTAENNLYDAWDAIFRYHNNAKGKGNQGYNDGEKITMKINLVSCDGGNMSGHNKVQNLNMIDGSPQLMWSVLNQLVTIYHVDQQNISLGDPSSYFPDQYYDILKNDFPDVVYLSLENAEGRTKIDGTGQDVIKFSDCSGSDDIPIHYQEADYMINISVLKHHNSAGFSQITKNHYGSNMINTASHMHSSLISNQPGMGHYRHMVDLMAHEHLGDKTLLNIGDFLWSGSKAWTSPVKYDVVPFNGDYPSSILVSQDPVAIESVGLDFIQAQSWGDNLATAEGVDDFLHQAADSSNWPDGLIYDPEQDGKTFKSLGVHEHWNNPVNKQYSRNLGTGNGIELVKIFQTGNGNPEPVDFEIISFSDIKPRGFPLQFCWNNIGIDSMDNIFIGFGNDKEENPDVKGDVAIFKYNSNKDEKELLGTFINTLEKSGNLEIGEQAPKGHTDMVYYRGLVYMGTQSYGNANKTTPSDFGSHLLAYDVENDTLLDISKGFSDGYIQKLRGLYAISPIPGTDYLAGLGSPQGDILLIDLKNYEVDTIVPGEHKNNITRNIITTADGRIFYTWGWEKTLYIYDIYAKEKREISIPVHGGKPFMNGWARTVDRSKVYLSDPEGTVYYLDTENETLSILGSMGSGILSIVLSENEKKLYSITKNDGYKLIEMDVETGNADEIYTFSESFGQGNYTFTGNNIRDSKGNIYFARHQLKQDNTSGQYDGELVKITIYEEAALYNSPPTLDDIEDYHANLKNENDTIILTGINDGNDGSQNLSISASTDTSYITKPEIIYAKGNNSAYLVFKTLQLGEAEIFIEISDDGANTPDDGLTYSTSFKVIIERYNMPPTIRSDSVYNTFVKNEKDTIVLKGISSGDDVAQNLNFSFFVDSGYIINSEIIYTQGKDTALFVFIPKFQGDENVNIKVSDNGAHTSGGLRETKVSFEIIILAATTMVEMPEPDILHIFPNPAYDMLFLVSNSTIHRYEIYTISGQKIIEKEDDLGTKKLEIDVKSLKQGQYILRVYTNTSVSSRMFFK